MADLRFKDMIPQWIREESREFVFPDYTRVDIPLLDSHNDFNSIYVIPLKNGRIRITDNSSSLSALLSDGLDVSSPGSRWGMALYSLIACLGVSLSNDTNELFIECGEDELKAKMGFFIQALVRVESMSPVSRFVLAEQKQKLKLRSQFKNLIESHSGKYEENVSCHGSSGVVHSFDFLLKGKRNESFVQLMQRPTKEFKEALIFEWDDVKSVVGASSLFAVKEKDEKSKEQTQKLDEVMYGKGISILSLDHDSNAIVKYLIA